MNVDTLKGSLIELEKLYAMTLAAAANSAGYTAVLQQMKANVGRLWLIPERKGTHSTTIPDACLQFRFEPDRVLLAIKFRDETRPEMQKAVTYVEGLDGFLEAFCKALTANRLSYNQNAKQGVSADWTGGRKPRAVAVS